MQKRHTYRQQSLKQNYDPSMPQNMSNKTVSETCERTKITKAKSPWGEIFNRKYKLGFHSNYKMVYFIQVKISHLDSKGMIKNS